MDLIGVGYIIIPENLNREQYINNCFRTETISIKSEDGYFDKGAKIDSSLLNQVKFPESPYKQGSVVVWLNLPKHDIPIIISVLNLNDNINNLTKENQIKISKSNGDNFIDIDGDTSSSILNMSVFSAMDDSGEFNISIVNPNDTAKFNLFVKGLINIETNDTLNLIARDNFNINVTDLENNKRGSISYKKDQGLIIDDEFGNIVNLKEDKLEIISEKKVVLNCDIVNLNKEEGGEYLVKGDTLNSNLSNLLNVLDNLFNNLSSFATTQASASGSPPLTPLSAGFSSLNIQLLSLRSSLNSVRSSLRNHLSNKSSTG